MPEKVKRNLRKDGDKGRKEEKEGKRRRHKHGEMERKDGLNGKNNESYKEREGRKEEWLRASRKGK